MESYCPKNKYHSFESITHYLKGQKETCIYCGKTTIWKMNDKGQIDNKKYLRYHLRDFCQPYGATKRDFIRIYGEKKYQEILHRPPKQDTKKAWDKIQDEAEQELKLLRKDRYANSSPATYRRKAS